jgi:alkanesulfonate monooxygenase
MSFEFSWHVPTGGDGRSAFRQPERLPRLGYLTLVAQAADNAGFDRVLVPCSFSSVDHGPNVDAYTLGVACLAATHRLRVVLTHRPGFINPAVFAHMCATADEMSQGRLALNIVTAGAPGDLEQLGDTLDHDARYRRAAEFVDVLQAVWTEVDSDYDGEFYRLCGARITAMPAQAEGPEIHLAGTSPAAIDMAVRQADVYMMQASGVRQTGHRIAEVRERAALIGRSPRFCVAATIFAADSDREALRRARSVTGRPDLEIAWPDGPWATTNGDRLLAPTPWSGLAHPARGAAWIGSYARLADLLCEYAEVGVSSCQLFGYPYLEQAMHIGERFVPIARSQLAGSGVPVSMSGLD